MTTSTEHSSQPYQLLPPLTPEEREALRESIATFGVLHPVVTDESGAIIDGHHRAEVAAEVGAEYQTIVLPGLTEEQKLEQALSLNLGRRHLTPEQKAYIVATLKARGLSVRWISEKTGIPRSTVHRLGGVPDGTPEYVTGTDGKHYRAQRLHEAPIIEARKFVRSLVSAGLDEAVVGPPERWTPDGFRRWLCDFPRLLWGGEPIPEDGLDEAALGRALWHLALTHAARALLRSGCRTYAHRPRFLVWPGRDGDRQESFETAAMAEAMGVYGADQTWHRLMEAEVGGFLIWCDQAGIDLAKPRKVPEPMDHYIRWKLWCWTGWNPGVKGGDVLTMKQRQALEDGPQPKHNKMTALWKARAKRQQPTAVSA